MQNVTLEMVYQKLEGIERELEEISEDMHRGKIQQVKDTNKNTKNKLI